MARNPYTTYFDPRDRAHRTVAQWRNPGTRTWQGSARAYAKFHGEARVLRADGAVICFRRTIDGTVSQRTYTKVVHVRD